MNYWLIFLTGLTSGGISCAAMQGGLLASVIANGKSKELTSHSGSVNPRSFDVGDWGPVATFLLTKWIAHIVLGALLGLVGVALTLSSTTTLIFQLFAALFMLGTAANLLELHPIFRYLSFSPPKIVRKLIKSTTHSNLLFAPAILGLLTVFIPCGVTQAMAVIAISSRSAVEGALIMGSFVAGTIPIFVLIGIATAKLTEIGRIYFLRLAAVILIGMALYSINGVLTVLDSPFSYSRTIKSNQIGNVTSQNITIKVENNGYTPNYFKVKSGTPVELTLEIGNVYSCAASFNFRAFNISTYLKPNTREKFVFTPLQKGVYNFSCSMGMYSGIMEVI